MMNRWCKMRNLKSQSLKNKKIAHSDINVPDSARWKQEIHIQSIREKNHCSCHSVFYFLGEIDMLNFGIEQAEFFLLTWSVPIWLTRLKSEIMFSFYYLSEHQVRTDLIVNINKARLLLWILIKSYKYSLSPKHVIN